MWIKFPTSQESFQTWDRLATFHCRCLTLQRFVCKFYSCIILTSEQFFESIVLLSSALHLNAAEVVVHELLILLDGTKRYLFVGCDSVALLHLLHVP